MRIDPAALVASLSSLADTAPRRDLAGTLQQVVTAANLLFHAKGAGIMLADEHGELRWVSASDQQIQLAEDNQELPAVQRRPGRGRRQRPDRAGRRADWHPGCVRRRAQGLGSQ